MYTIKQAAARSGLTVPTVRVWERRYGVVRPARTTSGYRLYDDDAIARLVAMRYLVESLGIRPSQAAEQLASAGPALDDLLATARDWAAPDAAPGLPPRGVAPATAGDAVAAYLAAARTLDVATMEATLDEAFAAERFEAAMDHVVFPALRAIGDGWANGSLDVAMEHAATEVVRRRLARFYDAAGTGDRPPTVIVGLPPGARHDIGVLAFGVAARRSGLGVLYLGADVPVESWVRAVESTAAPVAVVGVVTSTDPRPAAEVVAGLRGLSSPPDVLVGGAAAARVVGVTLAESLPARIEDAVAVVAARIATRS